MTSHVWWVSDTHFSHRNIIKYCDRPFATYEEKATGRIPHIAVRAMDEAMVDNWNARVRPQDEVWHLGDFGFAHEAEPMERLLRALNGRKHLILGNHDSGTTRRLRGWESVSSYREITVDGQRIVLCHYAMRVWNRSHHGALMLYGHSHGRLPGNGQSLDVGFDCWDYAPTDLDAIRARLATLPPYEGYAEQAGGGDHHVAI